jgi:hypothetical protein
VTTVTTTDPTAAAGGRAERSAATRRALLDSGRALFAARGFAGTAREDVVRQVEGGASGRIYATSSDANRTDALSKLKTAASRARKALDAHKADKPATAFEYLDLLFGGKFPAR